MSNKPLLVVIAGPTAAGKTSLSINLAQKLQTEIISADSRQFFQEMLVGTARPTERELQGVQHHFTGHMSISESYNVSQYEQDVLKLLHNLFSKHRVVLLTGGSGLYIKSVCEGIDNLPDPDPALREKIKETFRQYGIEALQKWLYKVDEPYYNQVDLQNPKRLMRAIEVCETSGKKYSELRKNEPKSRFFDTLKIALDMPRQELFNRINNRTDEMIASGLIEEAKSLLPFKNLNALNTVGYKELFRYLDSEISLEQAVTDIKTNTRRYAKRQLTWFKKDPDYQWFHPNQEEAILDLIKAHLKQ